MIDPSSSSRSGVLRLLRRPGAAGAQRGGLFVLSVGAEGPQVLSLRQLLAAAGYLSGTPSAVFDAKTAAALSAFQRDAELDDTGRFDRLTQLALRAANQAAKEEPALARGLLLLQQHADLVAGAARDRNELARWSVHCAALIEQQLRLEADAKEKAAEARKARAEAAVRAKQAALAKARKEARAKAAARARILAAAKAYTAKRSGRVAKALAKAAAVARAKVARAKERRSAHG